MTEDRKIQHLPEQELVRLAQGYPESERARIAASSLLSRYQYRIYAWCYRHMGDSERAMDLAQEVLLSAYRNIGTFKHKSRFSSWLFAIARNRCLSELRRPAILTEEGKETDDQVSAEPDPAQALIEKMDTEKLLELIRDHLGPREQEVLWLHCFERMPLETITRVLDIRQASGARGILQTARRRLRGALAKREGLGVGSKP